MRHEGSGLTKGPLQSIRVVDFTENMAGPFGTMILGDQGADVIKVESPTGDVIRHTGSGSSRMASYFANLNRSKRSLVIDLHRPASRDVLQPLLDSADVVVHSFRPKAAARLGLDAATVTANRPTVVHASIVGFGATGPLAGRPVYDHVIQAVSGMADLQRESAQDDPHLIRHGVVDKSTGHVLAQSICAALIERFRTGTGTTISISMLDVAVSLLWPDGMMDRTALDPELRMPAAALTFRLTPTADGSVSLVVLKQAQWQGLIDAFGLSDAPDEHAGSAGGAMKPGAILRGARNAIRSLPTDEVVKLLTANDVPCAPVVSLDEMVVHPQIVANGTLVEYEHPLIGPIRQPRATPTFASMQGADVVPAPGLGDHTEEILAEIGLSRPSIESLITSEVVRASQPSRARTGPL
jgi:crotonobetainyl-CoA:carnitine CoA-transferase CaiB-like acyl-CoA transferase